MVSTEIYTNERRPCPAKALSPIFWIVQLAWSIWPETTLLSQVTPVTTKSPGNGSTTLTGTAAVLLVWIDSYGLLEALAIISRYRSPL